MSDEFTMSAEENALVRQLAGEITEYLQHNTKSASLILSALICAIAGVTIGAAKPNMEFQAIREVQEGMRKAALALLELKLGDENP